MKGMIWFESQGKRKGSGWKNESRRHSLARKGVKTVLPNGRRFDISKFVAKGTLSNEFNDIDGQVTDSCSILDSDIKEFMRYRDEWIEFIESELSKMGFSDDEISYMQIGDWANGILFDALNDHISSYYHSYPTMVMKIEDLDEWIYNQTGDKVDTDDIVELIYNSIPLLDLNFNNVKKLTDKVDAETKLKLGRLGFDEDQIDEMQIDVWASNRLLDYVEDEMGWNQPSPMMLRTQSLEDWISDRVEK